MPPKIPMARLAAVTPLFTAGVQYRADINARAACRVFAMGHQLRVLCSDGQSGTETGMNLPGRALTVARLRLSWGSDGLTRRQTFGKPMIHVRLNESLNAPHRPQKAGNRPGYTASRGPPRGRLPRRSEYLGEGCAGALGQSPEAEPWDMRRAAPWRPVRLQFVLPRELDSTLSAAL